MLFKDFFSSQNSLLKSSYFEKKHSPNCFELFNTVVLTAQSIFLCLERIHQIRPEAGVYPDFDANSTFWWWRIEILVPISWIRTLEHISVHFPDYQNSRVDCWTKKDMYEKYRSFLTCQKMTCLFWPCLFSDFKSIFIIQLWKNLNIWSTV